MPDDIERPAPKAPGIDDIRAAARRLEGKAVKTPLLESALLNERTGGRVLIKPEVLQRTGSFKFRGAYNKISQLGSAARSTGIVAYSSGNHAQGVAAAAQLAGLPATIVMPKDAPQIKIDNTRAYGAEVVLCERTAGERERVAREIIEARGAVLVKPFDDPDIIAGQGTCGLELAEAAGDRDAALDAVLICCGGGGLTAGCALALQALSPATRLHTVEPAGFDDTARSLAAGERLGNRPEAASICDALLAPIPGELTFAINRKLLSEGLVVTDQEVRSAMAYAFQALKLVVEPGGAVTLAALLSGEFDCRGKTVAIVLSGGNVDPGVFAQALAD